MRASALLLAVCLAACSDPETESVGLALELVSGATGSCAAAHPTEALAEAGAATLRLTLLRSAAPGPPSLACDRVVDLNARQTDLTLEVDTSSAVDLLVEAFSADKPPRLLASGLLVNINARPRLRPLRLLLVRSDRFSCTPAPLLTPRGFHSATALPDGRVLLLGGLTQAAGGLRALDSAELFDPPSGRFVPVAGKLSHPRALHGALLLDGERGGPYDLLLVGGLAPVKPDAPAARLGAAGDALPLVPADDALTPPSVVVRLYPAAEPPRIEELSASPQLSGRVFHGIGQAKGGGVVVLGGLRGYSKGRPSTIDALEVLPTAGESTHLGPYPLQRARVGAAAGAAGSDGVLVFGGNMDSTEGSLSSEAAELVTLGAQGASSKLLALESGSASLVQPTVFSTLTPLSDGSLLLAGGLQLEPGQARKPRASRPVQRLSLVSGSLRVSDVASASFTPVALHGATAEPDGSVLLLGGLAEPAACAVDRLVCDKVWRYDPTKEAVSAAEPLHHGRIGHGLTWLPGDTLLVTGGLSVSGSAAEALGGAELSARRNRDPFGRTPGAAGKSGCD